MSAKKVALKFFDADRAQDVEQMGSLCTQESEFRYVANSGGSGKVHPEGVNFWSGLIDAFPDLTVEVTWLTEDNEGNAIASVVLNGTQAKDFAGITNRGRKYRMEHLFILHVNEENAIDNITGYYDDATWYLDLGKTQLS